MPEGLTVSKHKATLWGVGNESVLKLDYDKGCTAW